MPHKSAMNQLNVSLQHSITALAAQGWSGRRIARELRVNRETVGRYLRLVGSNPAKVLTGLAADAALKPAILLTGYAGDDAALAVSGAIRGSFSLLRKPVDDARLVDRLSTLLAAADVAN